MPLSAQCRCLNPGSKSEKACAIHGRIVAVGVPACRRAEASRPADSSPLVERVLEFEVNGHSIDYFRAAGRQPSTAAETPAATLTSMNTAAWSERSVLRTRYSRMRQSAGTRIQSITFAGANDGQVS